MTQRYKSEILFMESLATKIRQELNTYQAQVAKKLEDLYAQGLISQTDRKKIIIDAEITGRAVIDGLASQEQYTEETIEIYVYSLFERYKSKLDNKIEAIEKQQKSRKISQQPSQGVQKSNDISQNSSRIFCSIDNKRVPIYFKDEVGKLISPNKIEKEIALKFLENALEIPVKRITITVGSMLRKLTLTLEQSNFNNEADRIRIEEEKQGIQNVYHDFGEAISQLVDGDYPEEVKNKSKSKLLEQMQIRLGKNINRDIQKTERKSFWSRLFPSKRDDEEDTV